MESCPPRDTGPHECRQLWTCSHGNIFTRHEPDGLLLFGSHYCPTCKSDTRKEQARMDKVASEIGEAIERTG